MNRGRSDEEEERRMAETWKKVKDALYERGLDSLDETAKSLISLSSILVTIGFSVISAMVSSKILQKSLSLWVSFSGFLFFMLSIISSILVIFRRPLKIEQLASPSEISSEWERIRSIKYKYLKQAYIFFSIGIILEVIAILFMIILGSQ